MRCEKQFFDPNDDKIIKKIANWCGISPQKFTIDCKYSDKRWEGSLKTKKVPQTYRQIAVNTISEHFSRGIPVTAKW